MPPYVADTKIPRAKLYDLNTVENNTCLCYFLMTLKNTLQRFKIQKHRIALGLRL